LRLHRYIENFSQHVSTVIAQLYLPETKYSCTRCRTQSAVAMMTSLSVMRADIKAQSLFLGLKDLSTLTQ
jgi:hypothetical protein